MAIWGLQGQPQPHPCPIGVLLGQDSSPQPTSPITPGICLSTHRLPFP